MSRVLLAVAAVVLISASAPKAPADSFTQAWAPGQLVQLQEAETIVASVEGLEPRGCSTGPEVIDVMVLAALLALRTVSERVLSGRH
jgi:hypothetical protein